MLPIHLATAGPCISEPLWLPGSITQDLMNSTLVRLVQIPVLESCGCGVTLLGIGVRFAVVGQSVSPWTFGPGSRYPLAGLGRC